MMVYSPIAMESGPNLLLVVVSEISRSRARLASSMATESSGFVVELTGCALHGDDTKKASNAVELAITVVNIMVGVDQK